MVELDYYVMAQACAMEGSEGKTGQRSERARYEPLQRRSQLLAANWTAYPVYLL
jgi:hypothetical protein